MSAAILTEIGCALIAAKPLGPRSSIVARSNLVLMHWALQLTELASNKKGPRSKSQMHIHWAFWYWETRSRKPNDALGAIKIVQNNTKDVYPWERQPTRENIERKVRIHRVSVFAALERSGRDLTKLHAHLKARIEPRNPNGQ